MKNASIPTAKCRQFNAARGIRLLAACCPLLTACYGFSNDVSTSSPVLDSAGMLGNTVNNSWYQSAERSLAVKPDYASKDQRARNIILFVGDGMGISTITAARILAGQRQGGSGEESQLSFERFPYTGLSKTYNVDAQTPDSAGTMTALITGVKTNMGLLAVDEGVKRGDCTGTPGHTLISALELAELAGKSTGIVTTTRITHATPAASYAKVAERNWESDADLPEGSKCSDIASQLIDFEQRLESNFSGADSDGIDVIFGGGRRAFLPEPQGGKRLDGKDLIQQWQTQYPRGRYLPDRASFAALDTSAKLGPLLGLFNASHMRYEADRQRAQDEPSLSEMTEAAIRQLQNNPRGYLLIVEAGRIDHAHHAGNAYNALSDTIALSDAVAIADKLSSAEDTLIIVTADHSHVFTLAGYPKRGNPILGKVVSVGEDSPALDSHGQPYTTLGYANGRGFQNLGDETDADLSYHQEIRAGRQQLSNIDTTAPGYHQEALVPLSAETHGGEDVAIYARGPGASLVSGSNEQQLIFHIMNHAARLLPSANIQSATR